MSGLLKKLPSKLSSKLPAKVSDNTKVLDEKPNIEMIDKLANSFILATILVMVH